MVIHYSTPYPNVSTLSVHSLHFDGQRMVAVLGVQLPHYLIKYSAALLYLLLSLSGLLLNILWAAVLYLGHRHFSQRPFYIVSRHLMISDVLCVLGQLAIAVPLAFMDYKTALSSFYLQFVYEI